MPHHKQDIKKQLTDAWHIALLKKATMKHVAGDKKRTSMGYYIIVTSALLGFIGQQIFSVFWKPNLLSGLGMAVIQAVSTIIGIYVLSFIAKAIFKGSAKHEHFFRVMAYGMIVMWIGLIPQLSFISFIWGIILTFVILKTIHKLTTGGAIGAMAIGLVAMMVVGLILSPIYAVLGLKGAMQGTWNYDGKKGHMDWGKKGMNIKTDEGEVNFDMKGGSMKFTDDDGEVYEVEVPKLK